MARSLHSLVRSGVVSPRVYRKLLDRHAAAQSDDGGGRQPGAIEADEINDPAHGGAGSPARASGLPNSTSRGNSAPGVNAINKKGNRKKWPAQSPVHGQGNPSGPVDRVGVKSWPRPSGAMYGRTGNNNQ